MKSRLSVIILKYFLFLFYLFSSKISFSQELVWKNIGIKDGLPSSEVYQIYQDRKGYIWFATDAGVCLYDGNKIITFTTKDGLPENVVLGIYEDLHGRIWFRLLSGALYYYEKGEIKGIEANKELYKLLEGHEFVSSLFIGQNDTLFCSTTKDLGVLKIAPEGNYRKIILDKDSKHPCDLVIFQNNIDSCIVQGNGIRGSSKKKDKIYTKLLNGSFTLSIGNDVLLNSFHKTILSGDNTIYIPNRQKLIIIQPDKKIQIYEMGAEIFTIYLDRENNLWIGLYKKGLLLYPHANLKENPIHFLSENSISSVLLDKEKTLWVSTIEKGVFMTLNKNIFLWEDNDTKVGSFFSDNQKLYIGLNKGHKILSIEKGDFSFKPQSINIPYLSDLLSISRVKNTWIYATSNDLIISNNNKKYLAYKLKGSNYHLYVKQLAKYDTDKIAGFTRNVFFATDFRDFYKSLPLPDKMFSLVIYSDKRILLGTNKKGILEFKNNQFIPFLPQYKQLQTRLNYLFEDKKGNLWIGTNEQGLYIYTGDSIINYSEKDGLASDKIYEITADSSDNIWISTNKGLTKANFAFDKKICFTSFNETNGLPSNEIIKISAFGNRIFCATRDRLFFFNTLNLTKNLVPPPIMVSNCTINGLDYDYKKVSPLKYYENNLKLILNRLSYKGSGHYNYMYKLWGFDSDYNYSNYNTINYNNLPPGNYTLEIYAINNDGIKSKTPVKIIFLIGPPFWLKWWFILCEIATVLFLIYLIIKWRVNGIEKREMEKTILNKKIAEHQMNALRAQMNPHFIFNAINSIQHFILENNKELAYHYLAQFSKLIRLVLDNSRKNVIPLAKEIETIELYIDLEKIRFETPFTFLLHIENDIDIDEILVPPMLIQPFIENSIRHGLSPKKEDGLLKLNYRISNDELHITLIDNGIGREAAKTANQPNKKHISAGLPITFDRINLLKEEYRTNAKIEIVDLYNENNQPLGTKVEIVLPIDLC